MIAKKHEIDYKTIIAACDKEHIGKTFEEGEIYFIASEKFYAGVEVSESELEKLLEEADSINLFGDKCVNVALKKGFVSEKSIIKIKGIKHAQAYKI